jgi:hypothetical protein
MGSGESAELPPEAQLLPIYQNRDLEASEACYSKFSPQAISYHKLSVPVVHLILG